MNYDFSEKEFQLFVSVSEIMSKVITEMGPEVPENGEKLLRQAIKHLSQTPYLGLATGMADDQLGMIALAGAMETVASIAPSVYLGIEMSARVFGRIISTWGDDATKDRWLKPVVTGEMVGAAALSETHVNIENDPIKTCGTKTDDGHVSVNGEKHYVVNAPVADVIAVFGNIEENPAIFLIPVDTPGLVIDPPSETFGVDAALISSVRMENCKIPEDHVIKTGSEKSPEKIIRFWEDQVIVGLACGLMKAGFESARDHAKSHKTGGKPIIAYQEVGFKLAEMLTLYQTGQLMFYRAMWTSQNSLREAMELTWCAKVFCSEGAEQVCGNAMRIFGGTGYELNHPVSSAYRSSKYCQVFGTSVEISRVKLGDAALGLLK